MYWDGLLHQYQLMIPTELLRWGLVWLHLVRVSVMRHHYGLLRRRVHRRLLYLRLVHQRLLDLRELLRHAHLAESLLCIVLLAVRNLRMTRHVLRRLRLMHSLRVLQLGHTLPCLLLRQRRLRLLLRRHDLLGLVQQVVRQWLGWLKVPH